MHCSTYVDGRKLGLNKIIVNKVRVIFLSHLLFSFASSFTLGHCAFNPCAGVAKLVDAPDLGSGAARRGGSSPSTRTIFFRMKTIINTLRGALGA